MKIRQFFIKLFTDWTRPILFLFLAFVFLFLAFFFFDNTLTLVLGFCILLLALLTVIFSIFYQIYKQNYIYSFISFCSLSLFGAILYYFSIYAFLYSQSMPDKYADKLTIPKNIKIHLPSDSNFSIKRLDTFPNFQIYTSFQPGLYSYAVWTKKIERGYCYLKAFEISKNDPLSADRLKERSKIIVFNSSDTVKKFEITAKEGYDLEKIFTIYEGDWDKPYAARFEVWFVPANGGQERKLAEKNFKIEGWMR